MAVRQMSPEEIAETCAILQYAPHANITGLCNGSARILYDGWTMGMTYVHSLIPEPRYLTKGFLREMFRYAFEHVDWVVGVTPAFNHKALAFNRRLGFAPSLILPGGYRPGVDLIYQTMYHMQCRYYQRPAKESV